MLKETTCFINDAIGIDPHDCGCLDCCVGDSIPLGDANKITELIKAHLEEAREIVNRAGGTIIAYRTRSGDYEWDWVACEGSGATFSVIAQEEGYFDYSMDEGTVISDDSTSEEDKEGSVSIEDDARMNEVAEKHIRHGEVIINRTERAILFYGSRYGEFGFLSLDTEKDDPLTSVLPYH